MAATPAKDDAAKVARRAHAMSATDVAAALGTSLDDGLDGAAVQERLAAFGPNSLPEDPPVPLWRMVLAQFDDALVKILLAAAAVSLALGLSDAEERSRAYIEPGVIVLILILNALVGVWQESSAAEAVAALKRYESNEATVRRRPARDAPAQLQSVPGAELVVGDVISVKTGDRVPADCRLVAIESSVLRVDQSLLTGETESVLKATEAIAGDDENLEIQAKHCLVFAGTTVAAGSARAVVIATGSRTQLGLVGTTVAQTESVESPLKRRLDRFGDILSRFIAALCIAIWLANIPQFDDDIFRGDWVRGAVYYFKIAVALAVAAIPEGLPAVVTTCLALGTRRMAARNAIARSLPAVEALGTTSVICSDKTVSAHPPLSRAGPAAPAAGQGKRAGGQCQGGDRGTLC